MATLADVVHMPQVAALLVAYVAPRDVVSLVVWAMEKELHDAARQLIAYAAPSAFQAHDQDEPQTLVLHCAAASGSFKAARRLLQCGGLKQYVAMELPLPVLAQEISNESQSIPAAVLYEAATRGDQHAIAWLSAHTKYDPHEAMALLAANGHLHIARWLGQRTMEKTYDRLRPYQLDMQWFLEDDVGETDDLHALLWTVQFVNGNNQRVHRKYLATRQHGLARVQKGPGWAIECEYAYAMDVVAGMGDLALLQAMHDDQRTKWQCTSAAMANAATHGHLEVLQWLCENRKDPLLENDAAWGTKAMDGAARNGYVGVMEWLLKHKSIRLSASTLEAALAAGHMNVLQWLEMEHPDITASLQLADDTRLADAACLSANRLSVLQWLERVFNIRVATKSGMSLALSHGDVKSAQWLAGGKTAGLWNRLVSKRLSFEFGLWHNSTMAMAALNGHVEIVQWLAHAGPFHIVERDTLWQCVVRGHLAVVAFILENPAHQPTDLEFVPRHWSSFYDAVSLSTNPHHIVRYGTWHPLACDPVWAKPYVELWMRHRPHACHAVPWLSQWAMHCGHVELTQRLNEKP